MTNTSCGAQLYVATGWAGDRLLDWTNGGIVRRFYGTNGYGDTTWTAGSAGLVSATLRLEPWGNLTASTGSSLPDRRWQGSWFDTATSLYGVDVEGVQA
jgi:hypothetical protein